jgi:hypothetical protein
LRNICGQDHQSLLTIPAENLLPLASLTCRLNSATLSMRSSSAGRPSTSIYQERRSHGTTKMPSSVAASALRPRATTE